MASINTACHYGLNDLGAIAPGYLADIVTFSNLTNPQITRTFASGRLVAERGHMIVKQTSAAVPPPNNMLAPGLSESSFAIPAAGKKVRVIEVIPEQIVTLNIVEEVATSDGYVLASPGRDILKIAVVERHQGTGNVGVGLVKGFGLREGALASSIAHDSHNVVVVGASDAEMLLAARTVVDMGGGVCAVKGSELLGRLPLPVAGLMSDQSLEFSRDAMSTLRNAARSLGCSLSNPYMAMAFLALPVIPELKITDKGLVDVTAFRLCSLFVDSH
jgi:adenine deaminase